MSHSWKIAEAEKIVDEVRRRLPAELRGPAARVPVVFYDYPSEEILGEEFDPDILGMFVGAPHLAEDGVENSAPAHIMLFVENIAEDAEGDLNTFQEEVRITYLHELGHFFGWDEDDLEARGLG